MSPERCAIFYVPPKDSDLAVFGREFLGVDIETGDSVEQATVKGLEAGKLKNLTAQSKFYGFHGTLKPPFRLAPNASLENLLKATKIFAAGMSPIETPTLEIAVIGKFLALSPVASSVELENIASQCVRTLEAYRKRQTDKEMAQYRQSKLTVHQEQMLDNWGHPYVLEEFRFHMTLTDRIDDDDERASIQDTLSKHIEPLLGKAIPISDITICTQPKTDTFMRVVERFPFGRV